MDDIDGLMGEIEAIVNETNWHIDVHRGRQVALYACLRGVAARRLLLRHVVTILLAALLEHDDPV